VQIFKILHSVTAISEVRENMKRQIVMVATFLIAVFATATIFAEVAAAQQPIAPTAKITTVAKDKQNLRGRGPGYGPSFRPGFPGYGPGFRPGFPGYGPGYPGYYPPYYPPIYPIFPPVIPIYPPVIPIYPPII